MDPPTASTSATHSRERRRGDTCEIIYIQLYRVLGIIGTLLPLLKVEIPSREARLMDRYPQGISCI